MNSPAQKKRAVVLLSGGLDSATTLALAMEQGYECTALSVSYGQRHKAELAAADRLVSHFGIQDHRKIQVNLDAVGGSALTDAGIPVPESGGSGIPVTYVPARNTLFLSLALGVAEVIGAADIFLGVNAVDYSGYPDCRPAFLATFQELANLATKAGVEGVGFQIHAPLVRLSKAEIIRHGVRLGVNYADTISCYQATEDGLACGRCDSCALRRQGFEQAGIADPTRYLVHA